MAEQDRNLPARISVVVRFVAARIWVLAVVGALVALFVGSWSIFLLSVILVAFWEALYVALSAVLPVVGTRERTGIRYRFTAWGLAYCGLAGLFYLLSGMWGLNLVYLTTSFLIAAFAYAAIAPFFMYSRLSTEWFLPSHVFAGKPFRVDVTVSNRRHAFSLVGIEIGVDDHASGSRGTWRYVPRLAPGAECTLGLRESMPMRGAQELPAMVVRSRFPFGLLETSVATRREDDVVVLPRLGHIDLDAMLRQRATDAQWLRDIRKTDSQGEFRSLREYRSGDNPRHIHWPTTARLGKLHVKEFERHETRGVLIALDAHAPEEPRQAAQAREDRFETAVSFAATFANLLTARNMDYAFVSCCPEPVLMHYDCGLGHFYSLLSILALAQMTPELDVGDALAALGARHVPDGGLCVVSPGPRSSPPAWLSTRRRGGGTLLIDVSQPEFDEIFSF